MAENQETPEQKVARLEKELADANGIISEQTEQLATAELRTAGTLPVVKHEKEQYRVLVPTFTDKTGVKHTAADLAKNSTLIAQLVAEGSGILEKVEKPEKEKASK